MQKTRSSYDTTNVFFLKQKTYQFLKYARAYLRKLGRHVCDMIGVIFCIFLAL